MKASQKKPTKRRGIASYEAMMTAAVVVPVVFLFYSLTVFVCSYVYELMASLLGWPFL